MFPRNLLSSLQQTSGLGFINQSTQQDIKVHSCFAVSGEGGTVLLEPSRAQWQVRTGDGEPELKTLGRGMGVLHHLVEGAQLAAKA